MSMDHSQPGYQSTWFYALWKFSRPHTIIGTSLSVVGLYLITTALNHQNYSLLPVFIAWIACLCGNVYIVGLNQLQDVAIDKINKPHLPIASGEFSQETGELIVIVSGISALVISGFAGPYLFAMVATSLAIGTAYSLPPIRLKRFPFWAALCIFSVRGAIVNLGLFLHFNSISPLPNNSVPSTIWALTLFILVFTFAIAILKDIPDLEGDRQYNITTFTIQIGKKAVFNLALWILTICYTGMITASLFHLTKVNELFLLITHLAALTLMWFRSFSVDLEDKAAISGFYQFIWKLFFLEYLIFPAACIL